MTGKKGHEGPQSAKVAHPSPKIIPSPPEYSRSSYGNWIRPLPLTEETLALHRLKAEWRRNVCARSDEDSPSKEVFIIDIDDFEIYKSPGVPRSEYTLTTLHHFDVKAKELCINGVLSFARSRYYIEDVYLENYSIEGYDDDENPNTVVYVQSQGAFKDPEFDIWFRLNKCAQSYQRFYDPFLWLASFGKHVIDFLGSRPKSTVHLRTFKAEFHSWVMKRFPNCSDFAAWHSQFGKTDYRVAVHAYKDYLYNQAGNLSNSENLLSHPFWGECLKGDAPAIEKQPIKCKKTIATPIVYSCFKDMYFGRCLEKVEPHETVREEQERRKESLGFAKDTSIPGHPKIDYPSAEPPGAARFCRVGDVVCIKRDKEGSWKTTDEEWLAYVQKTEQLPGAVQRLFVLWFYRPADTTISTTVYPHRKELFLSDNCNCTDSPLLSTDVVRKFSVDWQPKDVNTTKDVLVRQKYLTQDGAFVTFKKSDLRCACQAKPTQTTRHIPGDCVYIGKISKGRKTLEPVVITRWAKDEVKVRQLVRLESMDKGIRGDAKITRRLQNQAAPNELVWTEEFFTVLPSRIKRKCHIRFFPIADVLADKVPTPYDRRGNGDFWFLSSRISLADGSDNPYLQRLTSAPRQLNQGYDPSSSVPWKPLRGLSIFSGGGNLDRGLEEGGAVEFRNVVDLSKEAVHTQLANAAHPEIVDIYWGTVDDVLNANLQGRKDIKLIARIGDIQFIAAGSPCPGFSSLQRNWMSDESLGNASHITSFCSFVDLYRPEYAILENVVSMANTRKGYEEEKVFSQLIACLVALGYQVQQFLMDAWNYSSPQRRSRLFVSITAPGLEPIPQPFLTHSHPDRVIGRSLGTLANGEPFGCREDYPTPFKYTTAKDATTDLPDIGSSLPQTCILFPDHRVVNPMNSRDRALMKRIPVSPPGQGYTTAMNLGLVPESLKKSKKVPGKSFKRIRASGLFPTITTAIVPQDARVGEILHWREHRSISILEARRAQGFLDHEVITGLPSEQLRVVGNAVDRNVALALGISLRRALEINYKRSREDPPPVRVEKYIEYVENTSSDDELENHESEDYIKSALTNGDVKIVIRGGKRACEDSTVVRLKKKTRHSGLCADLAPARWDRVPERYLNEKW